MNRYAVLCASASFLLTPRKLTQDVAEMEALGISTTSHELSRPPLVEVNVRQSHLGYRWPIEFDAETLDEQQIIQLWDNCIPFVVKNAITLMDPPTFVAGAKGTQICTTTHWDGRSWVDFVSNLQEYFQSWRQESQEAFQVRVCYSSCLFCNAIETGARIIPQTTISRMSILLYIRVFKTHSVE
jgi:hypothetical protein